MWDGFLVIKNNDVYIGWQKMLLNSKNGSSECNERVETDRLQDSV
jgi:hypothetical protein